LQAKDSIVRYLKLSLLLLFYLSAKEGINNKIAQDVKINADNINYYSSEKYAEAQGNVKLEYKLKSKQLRLKSNKLNARFDDKGKLIEVDARGQVEINYDGTTLKAELCRHSFKESKTICESEHVYLFQGHNQIHGQIARLDFRTQIFTMQAAAGLQMDSIIYPKRKE
jgi:lipopolysaccharide export system protein LptA